MSKRGTFLRLGRLFVTVWLMAELPCRGVPAFEFRAGALTITTVRYQAVWQNGCLVGLANRCQTQ